MNRTILVTGASSDLGMAYLWENEGAYEKIYAHYHRESEELLRLKERCGERLILLQADLSEPEEVQGLAVQLAEQKAAPTHVLHLASCAPRSVRFHKSEAEEYRRMVQVSVYSIIELLKAVLPQMQKQRYGRIVFLLSAYVTIDNPKYAAPYVTAKYALLGLMKDLAAEYAAKGITVNGISPQMIETKFLKDVPELIIEQQRTAGPLQRLLGTKDVLPVMKLLLSDEAEALTGENIAITGGNYIL